MVSAGTLWFSGDILCQYLVTQLDDEGLESKHFDWKRTMKMTLYGTFFSAPIYVFWFGILERVSQRLFSGYSQTQTPISSTPISGSARKNFGSKLSDIFYSSSLKSRMWKITFFKTFLDVIIFDPFYLSFFFAVTGTMEGSSIKDIKQKLDLDLKSTYIADIAVWVPIQLANFRYVPVVYQPMVAQGASLFWNTFLSWVQHKH